MTNNSYKDTTFLGMLKINGIAFFKNYSLLLSLFFFAVVHLLITNFDFCSFKNYDEITLRFFEEISGTSSSVFSIVIAAMAVSMTIFNQKILSKLEQTKLLHKFLFPFWFLVICWGTLLLISTFINVMFTTLKPLAPSLLHFGTAFSIWLFIYAILLTINITGLLIRLFIQNSKVN